MLTPRPKGAISWSGGKDSCLAFHRARQQYEIGALMTMFSEDGNRSRSHGLRPEVISAHANKLGVKSLFANCTWQTYEEEFIKALRHLRSWAFTHMVFGDILYEEHRQWAERVSAEAGLTAVEPLWGQPTSALFQEFLRIGGEARIVAVKAALLDQSWLGRRLDLAMLPECKRLGIDPCGENGEYHTLVINCPAFHSPLEVHESGHSLHDGYWGLDLTVET